MERYFRPLFCVRHTSLDLTNIFLPRQLSCCGPLELFNYLKQLCVSRAGRVGPWEALDIHSRAGLSKVTEIAHGLSQLHAALAAKTPVPETHRCPHGHSGPLQPLMGWHCALAALSETCTHHPAEEVFLPTAQGHLSNWTIFSLNICEYNSGNRLYQILGFSF